VAFHDWPDGKAHPISYAQHLANLRAKAGNPLTLPPPPVGTYDSALDYQSGAANRGLTQTQNDAQTQYEHGQQDYGLGLGDLTATRDRSLADLLTQKHDVERQYGILGHQQAQSAAQHGITSAGLLGKSAQIRSANQAHDVAPIDLASTRAGEDFTRGKTGLDLANARTFGGFNGNTILNPLTGQPEVGSLATGVARAGSENTFYQGALGQQMAQQAAGNGYISPLTQPMHNGISIGNTPLTGQQYQNGLLVDALLSGQKPPGQRIVPGVTINGKPVTRDQYNSGALVNALLGRH
jgi:hypothetical protein